MITQVVNQVGTLPLTAIQLITVGIITFCLSLATETWPSQITLPITGWVLASALIATSLRFIVQTHAQSLTPASHAALILTIEPVWTALLAGIWLGETMTLWQIVGCCFIFAALIISRWRWVALMLQGKSLRVNTRS